MAPPKIIDQNIAVAKMPTYKTTTATKITTRTSSRTSAAASMLKKISLKDLSKRKADQLSPPKGKTTKRSAFVDITNATNTFNSANIIQKKTISNLANVKKETVKISMTAELKMPTVTKINRQTTAKQIGNEENVDPQKKPMVTTLKKRESLLKPKVIEVVPRKDQVKVVETRETRSKTRQEVLQKKDNVESKKAPETKRLGAAVETKKEVKVEAACEVATRKSTADDSSLYSTALEVLSTSPEDSLLIITPIKKGSVKVRTPGPPVGVADFDKENWDDPNQVSCYAMDVFNYLKSRESSFKVQDYMTKQTVINSWMRSLLVDWMVDVQEHFELNHETLYLAVKVMDLYLSKKVVLKEELQLVGAASLFIASKFDERIPPAIEEFLHVCENIYTRDELVRMEIKLFKEVDFCLGMPLSYRFLRRYGRCCKTTMPILTLARYILEMSLMEYPMAFESESKTAAAALYLALRMTDVSSWTPTLEFYTGYKLPDFHNIAVQLNTMLHRKPKEQLRTVRNKYSHTIFFEVAKTPLLNSIDL